MKNSRRKFLRNTSIAGTSLMLLNIQNKNKQREIISCAADENLSLQATISSIKSGAWSDKSTWSGGKVPGASDTPLIVKGHTVTFNVKSATVAGVNVSGTLLFSNSMSVTLQSSKNVIVTGLLKMYPVSSSIVHTLRFIGVNESAFVGATMDPIDSDVGLWVTGAGVLDVYGSPKDSWTRTTDSVKAGATSFTVKKASGWQVGDEIVIVPTEKPPLYTQNWDDLTGTLTDSFLPKFERRTIKKIDGNTITIDSKLTYNHLAINSSITSDLGKASRNWLPEVANLTRNVRIEGTKDANSDSYKAYHRAHIFIMSSSKQNIQYMQGRYLGPRKLQGLARPTLITGRYALHFHHCGEGSRGTIVNGCSLYEIGSRCYAPHMSDGISMTKNVAFDSLGEAFWYDFQNPTHDCTWNNNLLAAIRLDGISGKSIGMELGQGDGNQARGNVAVFAGCGDLHTGGSYNWGANNEGIWVFENNLAHSTNTGVFSWQNSGNNHTLINYNSYNCEEGISLGAYGNSYYFQFGYHYNSKLYNVATAGNTAAVAFQKLFMDGANQLDYCARVQDSPAAPGIERTNKFINCIFRNFTKQAVIVASNSPDSSNEKQWKYVDLIECDFDKGKGYDFVNNNLYPLKNNTRIRVQPKSGTSYQTQRVNSSDVNSNIARFAASVWGSGKGLTANYYNGMNFDSFAFSRIDTMIMFQQWSVDVNSSPNGVHHLITGEAYSIRWTGMIEAQFTEAYKFYLQGSSGFRLWVNDQQIINNWYDRADNAEIVTSSLINLVAGKKYSIKLECMNGSMPRGCLLYWQCPSLLVMSNVPMSQLYPGAGSKSLAATSSSEDDVAISNVVETLDVTIYPNPSTTNFKIQFKGQSKSPISINVFDNSGNLKFVNNNIQNNSTLSFGDRLSRGKFYAIVTQDGKSQTVSLLKL